MKQRIYRNYFWVALTTILIVSFVFVFSYNRTIHDQKEEGMREEAEFISALLEKQGDADVGFQAADAIGVLGIFVDRVLPCSAFKVKAAVFNHNAGYSCVLHVILSHGYSRKPKSCYKINCISSRQKLLHV